MRPESLLRLLTAVCGVALLGSECMPAYEPCDEYVDYVCDCHADDDREGYDCETLRITYQNADPELQSDCSLALGDLQDQDDAEGYTCATDSGL